MTKKNKQFRDITSNGVFRFRQSGQRPPPAHCERGQGVSGRG